MLMLDTHTPMLIRGYSYANSSFHRGFEGAPNDFGGRQARLIGRRQEPRHFRGLVAQGDQCAERLALRRLRGAGVQRVAREGGQGKFLHAVAHLNDDSFRGFSADAGNSLQHGHILGLDGAQKILHARPGQHTQCDLRPHSRYFEQPAEQAPLAVGSEAEQNVRILAHHQVSEQRDRFTGGRQPVKSRHRRFQFIADAIDIQHQGWRLLHRQPALEEADHPLKAARSRIVRPRSAWHTAAARASAASAGTGPSSFSRLLIISCTCAFSALPVPTTACLIWRVAYSNTSTLAFAVPQMAAPRAWPNFKALSGLRFMKTFSMAISCG